MALELIFPEEELAVTTPRQLAPTVGPVMKGVEIVGAARRGMEKLAIGRVFTNQHGETEINDYGWSPEMDEVEEGYQFNFGKISVFVGMVGTTGNRANELESVSEATAVVESDGEESIGTSEVGIVAEPEEHSLSSTRKRSRWQSHIWSQTTTPIQSQFYLCLKIDLGMESRKSMNSHQHVHIMLEST